MIWTEVQRVTIRKNERLMDEGMVEDFDYIYQPNANTNWRRNGKLGGAASELLQTKLLGAMPSYHAW